MHTKKRREDDWLQLHIFTLIPITILVSEKFIPIENRIYREELKESLGMNFVSPFQPEREFKVYKSCKCSQIICSRVH